ncbi:hypothetical protein DPMN_187402 [Dreissena polymorpha]|uniref:Endonuclease/exonuclease/phosphatase domain-containing protein n=1 Tax=Dreissena polymorpha TaxID=45954 RepID=A0A9D4DQ41_DREPO|nr:hypothetical protein DPMN_187402 [Dreissena polymorpha]
MYMPVQKTVDSESKLDDPSANNVTKINKIDGGGDSVTRADVKLMIMNANGRTGKGNSDKRKNAIHDIIVMHQPAIVFLQEFKWKRIRDETWKKYPIPQNYKMYDESNGEACIMIDANHFVVRDVQDGEIKNILSDLQKTSNNRQKKPFPTEFDPEPRMCLRKVESTTKPTLKLICISWHGEHNIKNKIGDFEFLMFFRQVKNKYKMAMLIGGDFDIDMESIKQYVNSPFKLCEYEAAERRIGRKIIDFYIVSDEITLGYIQWVDLQHDTTVDHPNGILDHDPLLATLKLGVEAEKSTAFLNRNAVSDTKSNRLDLERDTTVVHPNEISDYDPVLATLKHSLEVEILAAYANKHALQS